MNRYYALEYNPKTKECFILGYVRADNESEARLKVNQKYFKYIDYGNTELRCASEAKFNSEYRELVGNTKT